MSVEKFIVSKEDSNYSVIPNVISQKIRDAEVLGLYLYLMSLPPNWVFYKEVIRNHFGWGRDKLDKKLTILKSYNLIDIIGNRNKKGQFINWKLDVKCGRHFQDIQSTENQSTENPCTGELSTGLSKNSTQYTENTAAVKPVTGFSTPIKDIDTKEIDFKKKSFCASAQKKLNSPSNSNVKSKSALQESNAKKHDFADKMDNTAASKVQMDREAQQIEQNNAIKRAPMPESLREIVRNMKLAC